MMWVGQSVNDVGWSDPLECGDLSHTHQANINSILVQFFDIVPNKV
jgi:hypothetical protein